MVDQITDIILYSLNYFLSGEQLADTEIPEGRGQVRLHPLLKSHYQNQKHSAFRWEATWAVSVSPRCGETRSQSYSVHKLQLPFQRKTTTEAEWNTRPSAYRPSYCLTATPSWPPKLSDNPVSDYMCVALAVGSLGPPVSV